MTLDDLLTPLTIEEARTSIYSVLAQLGVPTTGWKTGAVVRTIVSLMAVLMCACSILIVAIAKGGFRETATGAWQTLHARDTYGVVRLEASFGTGTVTLRNRGGSVYNPAPGDVIIQHATTGKTYRNAAAFYLGSGTSLIPTYVTIDVIAVESGTASNATPSVAMVLSTPMSGVDVTGNTAIIGNDAETDDALKAREDESLDALSPNGPAGAYLALAKTAVREDGSNVGVTRASVSAPSTIGEVTVTVASATGAIAGHVGDEGDDLDLVDKRIKGVTGPGCVPAGVTEVTASAVEHAIVVTADLYIYTTDSREQADIEDAALALVVAWFATRPISGDSGGKVYASAIRAKAMSVSTYCYNGTLTYPAADEDLSAGEVPVVDPTSSITVHLVAP